MWASLKYSGDTTPKIRSQRGSVGALFVRGTETDSAIPNYSEASGIQDGSRQAAPELYAFYLVTICLTAFFCSDSNVGHLLHTVPTYQVRLFFAFRILLLGGFILLYICSCILSKYNSIRSPYLYINMKYISPITVYTSPSI